MYPKFVSYFIDDGGEIKQIEYRKSSIFNLQFPDKSGFTLRYNRLVRVGHH
jgi:hypothetical protein